MRGELVYVALLSCNVDSGNRREKLWLCGGKKGVAYLTASLKPSWICEGW